MRNPTESEALFMMVVILIGGTLIINIVIGAFI